jgi:hypothetical protein
MPFDMVRDALAGRRGDLNGCAYAVACIHENVATLTSTLGDLVVFSESCAQADALGIADSVVPLAAHYALRADPVSQRWCPLRAPASIIAERRAWQRREELLSAAPPKQSFLRLVTENWPT